MAKLKPNKLAFLLCLLSGTFSFCIAQTQNGLPHACLADTGKDEIADQSGAAKRLLAQVRTRLGDRDGSQAMILFTATVKRDGVGDRSFELMQSREFGTIALPSRSADSTSDMVLLNSGRTERKRRGVVPAGSWYRTWLLPNLMDVLLLDNGARVSLLNRPEEQSKGNVVIGITPGSRSAGHGMGRHYAELTISSADLLPVAYLSVSGDCSNPMNDFVYRNRYADYRNMGGLIVPTTIVQSLGNGSPESYSITDVNVASVEGAR